jgi:hypothetical protein
MLFWKSWIDAVQVGLEAQGVRDFSAWPEQFRHIGAPAAQRQ